MDGETNGMLRPISRRRRNSLKFRPPLHTLSPPLLALLHHSHPLRDRPRSHSLVNPEPAPLLLPLQDSSLPTKAAQVPHNELHLGIRSQITHNG